MQRLIGVQLNPKQAVSPGALGGYLSTEGGRRLQTAALPAAERWPRRQAVTPGKVRPELQQQVATVSGIS